jgi:hypothetical protein
MVNQCLRESGRQALCERIFGEDGRKQKASGGVPFSGCFEELCRFLSDVKPIRVAAAFHSCGSIDSLQKVDKGFSERQNTAQQHTKHA